MGSTLKFKLSSKKNNNLKSVPTRNISDIRVQ
jgi:hypothetical protein